jgi:hypothetical protein
MLPTVRRIALSLLVPLSVLLCAPAARADLGDDAERIVKMWSGPGRRVERLSAVFVDHGRVKLISIDAAWEPASDAACVTVALLATRWADFSVSPWSATATFGGGATGLPSFHPPVDGESRQVQSSAGVAVVSRCGPDRRDLAHLAVELRSARAVLEVVVVRSTGGVEPPEVIFPERASGPFAPRGNPGLPASPGTLSDRNARARSRAREEGADRVASVSMTASQNGTGQFSLALSEGCHRLEVMAEAASLPAGSGARSRPAGTGVLRPTDIDAEAREANTGRVVGRDRSDAADGRLSFCLGTRATVEVRYVGAPGAVTVTLQDAVWPIPLKVPSQWGAPARGGFAAALRSRRAPEPLTDPIFQTLGVHGQTAIPFGIEPGKCYLAVVALIRGEAQRVRLAAALGGRFQRDEAVERPESAGVAFCSEDESDVLLDVDVRGSSAWWVLVIWPMGGSAP